MLLILGLTLILSLLETTVEKIVLKIIFFINKKDRNLQVIVYKNMESHKRRNEKTTIMYSIALAFLIFSGTGFNLQVSTISSILSSAIAADIKVMIPLTLKDVYLDEAGLRSYMVDYMKRNPDQIQDFTFVTERIRQYPDFNDAKLSPLS